MRLIDADALKEEMNKKALDLANGGMIFIETINNVIDNAPTVEPNDVMFKEWFCPDCKARENSYIAGYNQAIIDGADMKGEKE